MVAFFAADESVLDAHRGFPGRTRAAAFFQGLGFHSGFAEFGLQSSWSPAFFSLDGFSVPGSGCSLRHFATQLPTVRKSQPVGSRDFCRRPGSLNDPGERLVP